MRLFLAIDLPGEAKQSLNAQLVSLQKEYPVFNWVQTQNFHMTVHFFGETNKAEEISRKTKDILYDQEPFYLYANHLDLFMSQNITVYVNFRREKLLEGIIEKTRGVFSGEFKEVKTFIPHITVARTKIPSKQQYFHLVKKLTRTEIDLEFKVSELSLFESIISSKKPVYRKIESIPFAGSLG